MNEHYTRRRFLQSLAVVATSATLLPLLDSFAQAAPARAFPVGKVGAFKPGAWTPATLPGTGAIYVRRLPGKAPRFQALSALCTHKGCPVAWKPGEKQFVCPCHAGKFDANGRNVGGPPPTPLRPLPVKVVKGVVTVSA